MTILSICQNAAVTIGMPRPVSINSATAEFERQLKQFFHIEGRELLRLHDWSELITARSFTCAATQAQAADFPADFERLTRNSDIWNDTSNWRLTGPTAAQDWMDLQVRAITMLPQYWRRIGGQLNIFSPHAGDTISYEYVSKKWINSAGDEGVRLTASTADTDTAVYPEDVMELGLVWRFKQAKGLDYAEDMATYGLARTQAIAADRGGSMKISTDPYPEFRPGKIWPGVIVP